jgi:hypothetical protein
LRKLYEIHVVVLEARALISVCSREFPERKIPGNRKKFSI